MPPWLVRISALVAAAGVLAGCSSSIDAKKDAQSSLSGSITVYAAASLTGTFRTLGSQFEKAHPGTTVRFNFGPSSALATQINEAAPADVFASAAVKNMDSVVTAGSAGRPSTFARNTMEIAAAPGNPAHITSVADLAKSSVKVALCDPAVPCGAVAAKVFDNAGVTVKPVTSAVDVKSTLATIASGEVDAGLVYVTDVKAAGSKVVGVPIPDAINAVTEYPIATLTHAKNPTLAAAFVSYVRSTAGLAVLTAAGFGRP
ncbi:MAG: molybdate ABC transporter substrate-binding protein [Actinomycetota bacterium]|nr:molybdate ABC transporter substrate-binding protein [Actinomycetota bacterium]